MKTINQLMKNEKGVTFIEILVVVIIIGILGVYMMPRLNFFTSNSQVRVVETDIRLLKSNVQEHFIDNPTQPLNASLLKEYFGTEVQLTSGAGADPAYYKLPEKKDPWGNPYEIIVGQSEYYIAFHSYGPNGTNNIQSGVTNSNLRDDVLAIFYPKP